MHNLFLVYFVNLHMFRAYLGPSSGGTTVCIKQLVLIILFRWLSVVLVGLFVCLFWMLCVVRYRSLRWADPSSRGVVPSVCVCMCACASLSVIRCNNPLHLRWVSRRSSSKEYRKKGEGEDKCFTDNQVTKYWGLI